MPDFLIIGAMKSGTTSLHSYLALHPEIGMSAVKELDFFVAEKNWSKGFDWYRSQFPSDRRLIGEASTSYSKFPVYQGVPERIHAAIPEAKIIYVLRHPIERILANELHWREFGGGPTSFERALRDFIDFSRYNMQLERFLAYFPRDRIHVLLSEDLRHDRMRTLRRIYEFLGVDADFQHPEYQLTHNSYELRLLLRDCEIERAQRRGVAYVEHIFAPGWKDPSSASAIDAVLRREIANALTPDIESLRRFLGIDRAPWDLS